MLHADFEICFSGFMNLEPIVQDAPSWSLTDLGSCLHLF